MSPSKSLRPFLKTQRRDSLSILESIDEKYLPVFRGLRLAHIITDFKCAGTLENENIIPRSWINQEYRSQWLRMLRVENSFDAGECILLILHFLLILQNLKMRIQLF